MATFDWIPILQGKYMTYYQIGALIFSAICLLFAFLSFLAYLILSKFQYAKQQHNPQSRQKKLDRWKKIAFASIFVWLSFIPLICSSLDVLYLVEGIIGMFAILLVGIYLLNGITVSQEYIFQAIELQEIHRNERQNSSFIQNQQQRHGFFERCLKKNEKTKKLIIIALVMSIFLPVFFYKTCISFYNDQIGYTSNLFGPALNTYWARLLELKRSCPPGPPCHVYVTIPEDPTTAFFLNVHTHAGLTGPVTVYYQELFAESPLDFSTKQATSYEYPQIQWLASRKIHSVLISNLKPNTKYLLKVKYDNQFYTNAIYKTLPADPKTTIRMINGGDSGFTHASYNLSKLVATYKPDIFFMGGDIAYDNNIPACAYTWDFFLNMIQGISNEVGYIIPLVLTVGNHDVGLNELSGINITLDKTPFFKYFPQQFHRDSSGNITDEVPPVNTRRSFMSYYFGNVVYVTLDSGYLHGFDGYQKNFIRQTLSANKKKIKFVNYHVPIYSVCERFDKNPRRYLYALFHWVPLFDDYKVMTVFENHVHSFKRTKPLKSNQPAENGTVYVGDGAYGAVLAMLCKPDATVDLFQTFKNKNNVWISEIRQKEVYHMAFDSMGNQLDEFTQQVSSYTQ